MISRLWPQAQACGKVLMFGEHAVVYGCPAIAAGIRGGLELRTEMCEDPEQAIELEIPDWNIHVRLDSQSNNTVVKASREVLRACNGPLRGFRIQGSTTIPCGAGLGSSAALTVALARLVLGPDAPLSEVIGASLRGEQVFHGRPSGVDSVISARGGLIRFVKGEDPVAIEPGLHLNLIVVDSRCPRSTASQVQRVADRFERIPSLQAPLLQTFQTLVTEAELAIKLGNINILGEIMNVNHELLGALGVSTPILDSICEQARDCGALGAKLTGAGGGGCVVALDHALDQVLNPSLDGDREGVPLHQALKQRDLSAFPVEVANP